MSFFARASSPSKRRAFFCGALRRNAEHDDGVGGNLGGEGGGGFAEVFLGPEVADGGGKMSGIAEIFPRRGDIGVGGAAIEKYDGATAVFQLFGPDFGVAVFADAAALHAEGILVDGDDFLVGENFLDFGRHVLQIVSGHQGSGENAPEAEVGAIFGSGHAAVADFQHVRIIPVARAGVRFQADLQALGMVVVGEGLDAGGESFRVGDNVAGGVTADLPAIVNDDVFVTGVLHAAGDEGVGGRLDELLGNVAAETVPTVPAHRGSESQTVFQGPRGWNAKKNSKEGQRETARFLPKPVHENLSAYSRFISFRAQRQNCPRSPGE